MGTTYISPGTLIKDHILVENSTSYAKNVYKVLRFGFNS